jgi:sulfur carrier protein ThiS
MTQIQVKLFASLSDFLPADAHKNATRCEVADDTTVESILERMKVPLEMCHLVLLNGDFVPPGRRKTLVVSEGDTVAVWPPIAGG